MDRNADLYGGSADDSQSLSARRAWIEIKVYGYGENKKIVALRKESVDRNVNLRVLDGSKSVALRKESVDRNKIVQIDKILNLASLSARRAWIEMQTERFPAPAIMVALRKESVDRNTSIDNLTQGVFKSLSARRAWIEIKSRR